MWVFSSRSVGDPFIIGRTGPRRRGGVGDVVDKEVDRTRRSDRIVHTGDTIAIERREAIPFIGSDVVNPSSPGADRTIDRNIEGPREGASAVGAARRIPCEVVGKWSRCVDKTDLFDRLARRISNYRITPVSTFKPDFNPLLFIGDKSNKVHPLVGGSGCSNNSSPNLSNHPISTFPP